MSAADLSVRETVFEHDGIRLWTRRAGREDGPLVILLHGFPEFGYAWRRQMGALAAAGFHVVAPDQRGYGQSSKPAGVRSYEIAKAGADVVAIADRLGREKFFLAGHDWGGMTAWEVAIRYPEHVERAVIMNAAHPDVVKRFGRFLARHPTQLLRSWYVFFFQIPWLPERLMSAFHHAALEKTLVWTSRAGTFLPDELVQYRHAWAQPGAVTGMVNWYRALFRAPRTSKEVERRVGIPVRIAWGMRDVFLLSALAEESLRYCDRATLVPFPTAGHWLHLEEPDAVSRLLIESFTIGSRTSHGA